MLLDDAHATTEIGHMNDSSEHPASRPFPPKNPTYRNIQALKFSLNFWIVTIFSMAWYTIYLPL